MARYRQLARGTFGDESVDANLGGRKSNHQSTQCSRSTSEAARNWFHVTELVIQFAHRPRTSKVGFVNFEQFYRRVSKLWASNGLVFDILKPRNLAKDET